MTTLLIFSTTEHLLVLSAFLFPPVLIIILLVILLATFGKSLGLRERYVSILIRIFEWGAGEIKSSQNDNKKMSFELGASDCEDEDFGLLEYSDAGHYCSLDLSSTRSPSDSGFMPDSPLARSANSLSSLRKCSSAVVRNGSSTSLCSASSGSRMRHSSGQSIIIRETAIHLDEDEYTEKTMVNSRGWQVIRDSLYFMKAGVEAIIYDEVTSRFQAEQLASWNMLTRTSVNFYQFVNWKLTMLWVLGFLFRYFFLLPMRLIVFSVSLITVVFGTAVIGLIPKGRLKQWMNEKLMLVCMRIASRAFSALIYFHDTENKAKSGAICVANHTSPIDVMILGTDAVYALIGQCHSGFLGAIQRALSRASSHIWFERSEAKDRSLVARRISLLKILLIVLVATLQLDCVSGEYGYANIFVHGYGYVVPTQLANVLEKMQTKITEIDKKIDVMDTKFEGKIAALDMKIAALDMKIDMMGFNQSKLDAKIDSMDAKIDGFQSKFESLYTIMFGLLFTILACSVTISVCIWQCPKRDNSAPVQVLPIDPPGQGQNGENRRAEGPIGPPGQVQNAGNGAAREPLLPAKDNPNNNEEKSAADDDKNGSGE